MTENKSSTQGRLQSSQSLRRSVSAAERALRDAANSSSLCLASFSAWVIRCRASSNDESLPEPAIVSISSFRYLVERCWNLHA